MGTVGAGNADLDATTDHHFTSTDCYSNRVARCYVDTDADRYLHAGPDSHSYTDRDADYHPYPNAWGN